jgi:ABC-type polysaccharide/polyol phosphate transport system ATPase subunit
VSKEIAIKIEELSKQYFQSKEQGIIALNNISTSILKGSIVGLVGENGCGKSTLLSILAGIIKPTTGRVVVYGNILALTDIGAGFHPELSGFDNIEMVGKLFGVSKEGLAEILPKIIDFSELNEQFLRMPIKNYSQGMFLRLAFSTYIHFPVDILLLDEVLAVGDANFRQKCFRIIKEKAEIGLTVVLVSHTYEEVIAYCERAIVLKSGEIIADDKPENVFQVYMESINLATSKEFVGQGNVMNYIKYFKTDLLTINSIKLNTKDNSNNFDFTKTIIVSIEWEKLITEGDIYFDILITDKLDRPIVATSNYFDKNLPQEHTNNYLKKGTFITICELPAKFFNTQLFYLRILGSYYFENDKSFPIFHTNSGLRFLISNNEIASTNLNWKNSEAPIRTIFSWE